jgi:hypothetical protein
VKIVTIKQSLQQVADNPVARTDDLLSLPSHELVARTLFEIANGAKMAERNSLSRANVARNMILTRLVGKRRPGSHPATETKVEIEFVNLTGEEIEA